MHLNVMPQNGSGRGILMERRRETARIEMSQVVKVLAQDGQVLTARFFDLSHNGFKIGHDGDLLVGDRVIVVSARGTRAHAEIKWVADRMAGGLFSEPPEPLG